MGIFKLNGIDYMSGGGGGNANEQTLTWTEYCALTEEEKSNGTTYYITDINGEGKDGFQPVIYSTEEREIGVWTDGKPLYQRTLFYTGDTIITVSANSSSTYSATGITDIYVNDILPTLDQLIHYQIDLTFDGNEKNIYQFEYCFQASTGTFIRSHNPGIDYIGYNIIPGSSITLQYTKTTDQPGSGIWTPQGVPAAHYSINEQIVGTWIDGKTIYEKAITGTLGNTSQKTIDLSSEINCNLVIDIKGWIMSTDSSNSYQIWMHDAYVRYYLRGNNNLIIDKNGADNYGWDNPYTFIIRYTKTT